MPQELGELSHRQHRILEVTGIITTIGLMYIGYAINVFTENKLKAQIPQISIIEQSYNSKIDSISNAKRDLNAAYYSRIESLDDQIDLLYENRKNTDNILNYEFKMDSLHDIRRIVQNSHHKEIHSMKNEIGILETKQDNKIDSLKIDYKNKINTDIIFGGK